MNSISIQFLPLMSLPGADVAASDSDNSASALVVALFAAAAAAVN